MAMCLTSKPPSQRSKLAGRAPAWGSPGAPARRAEGKPMKALRLRVFCGGFSGVFGALILNATVIFAPHPPKL